MKYVCGVCGFIYDEETEGKPFSLLEKCPVCQQPASVFTPVAEEKQVQAGEPEETSVAADLAYDPAFARTDPSVRYMSEIHQMAVSGESLHAAMGTAREDRESRAASRKRCTTLLSLLELTSVKPQLRCSA